MSLTDAIEYVAVEEEMLLDVAELRVAEQVGHVTRE